MPKIWRGHCLGMKRARDETTRHILRMLSEGRTQEEVLRLRPELTKEDLAAAAAAALEAMEGAKERRGESRQERVARLRQTHPRAYEPWTDEEDARLLRRHDEGARIAELAREMGRPPAAVRARLDRWLGPSWRTRGLDATRPG